MNKTKRETAVGFVTVLALTILIFSIIFGKNISFDKNLREIKVIFETVNGLEKGSKVFVYGVSCGSVKSVDLKDKFVEVKAEINEDIKIHIDAYATVENKEIMGGKMLVIHPGTSSDLLINDPIKGQSSLSINQAITEVAGVVKSAGKLIERTDSILLKLNKAVPEKSIDKRFDELTIDTKKVLASINSTMRSVESKFDLTAEKSVTLIDSIQGFVSNSNEGVSRIIPELEKLIKNSDSLIQVLNTKAESITDTTGSFGRFIESDEMYIKLINAITNIDSLVKKIDREGLKTNIDIW